MEKHIVTAEKLVFGGESLARIQGEVSRSKVLFLPDLIPGEVAEVEIIESRKDFDKGRVLSILEPSPHRIQPECPYYADCGGCNMLHIEGSFQVELRKQALQDSFQREGVAIPEIDTVTGKSLDYRCRMQLTEGGLQRRGRTGAAVPIDKCLCGTDEINGWLQNLPADRCHKGRIQLFGDARVQDSEKVLFAATEKEGVRLQVSGKSRRKVQDKVQRRFSGTSASPWWSIIVMPLRSPNRIYMG